MLPELVYADKQGIYLMCRRRIGINARSGCARGEYHGSHPPFAVFAGKSLRHKEGGGHDIVCSAQRSVQFDGAVHRPVVLVNLLHIHAIHFCMLVMDESLANNHQLLGAVPVAAHMDEHGIGVEDFF